MLRPTGDTKRYREIASDIWLDNTASHAEHQLLGFDETGRLVHYRKALDSRDRIEEEQTP